MQATSLIRASRPLRARGTEVASVNQPDLHERQVGISNSPVEDRLEQKLDRSFLRQSEEHLRVVGIEPAIPGRCRFHGEVILPEFRPFNNPYAPIF